MSQHVATKAIAWKWLIDIEPTARGFAFVICNELICLFIWKWRFGWEKR